MRNTKGSANGLDVAGKSVTCAKIIEHIQKNTTSAVVFFFCDHYQSVQKQANIIFRDIAAQLFCANTSMAPYILETFASNGLRPSTKRLRIIIEKLVEALSSVRFVIDGIDECDLSDQKNLLEDLLKMQSPLLKSCKILFSTRRQHSISKFLQMKPTIKIESYPDNVSNMISSFVHARLGDLRQNFDKTIINQLERQIVEKADG